MKKKTKELLNWILWILGLTAATLLIYNIIKTILYG